MEGKAKENQATLQPQNPTPADDILTDIIAISVPSSSNPLVRTPNANTLSLSTDEHSERPNTTAFTGRLHECKDNAAANRWTNPSDIMELKNMPSNMTLDNLLRTHNDRVKTMMHVELVSNEAPREAKQDYDQVMALQQAVGELCAATTSTDCFGGCNHGNKCGCDCSTLIPDADTTVMEPTTSQSVRSIGSLVCRICHNSENPEKLVSPCLCKGSLSYVHVHCLERWISTSRSTVCELCQFQYNTEQTLRYTCLQSLRMWYSRAMSRRALQEDCQMFSLLTLVAFGIVGTLLVGIQYYFMQARSMGLGRLWTKGWLLFFLFTTLAVYFMNIYMIVRSQLTPWYRWWQSARDIKLILENRKPFTIRTTRLQPEVSPPQPANAVSAGTLTPQPVPAATISTVDAPSLSPVLPLAIIAPPPNVPVTTSSTVYFLSGPELKLLPDQEPLPGTSTTNPNPMPSSTSTTSVVQHSIAENALNSADQTHSVNTDTKSSSSQRVLAINEHENQDE